MRKEYPASDVMLAGLLGVFFEQSLEMDVRCVKTQK